MLEWLKTILGDSYTEEIDKKVSAEIGKGFVSKTDFNVKNEDLKKVQEQLVEANKTIEGFKDMDIDTIRKEADEWKDKAEQAEKDAADKIAEMEFNSRLTTAITGAKGKSARAILGELGEERLTALKASKNQEADINAALETLKQGSGYLFEDEGGSRVDTGGPHGPGSKTDYSKMSDEEYYAATMKKE